MKRKIALESIISLLILLFLYTGLTQLLAYKYFHGNIYNQPIFQWSKPILVYAVPGVQLLIVAGLLFEKTRMKALWASLILLSIFAAYIVLIILNMLARVPCSCGGVISTFTWPQHLVFNLFFMLLNVIAIVLMKKRTTETSVDAQLVVH